MNHPEKNNADLLWINDPGHAWLRVKRAVIPRAVLARISAYSYESGQYVYLEEDEDAGKYLHNVYLFVVDRPAIPEVEDCGQFGIRQMRHYAPRPQEVTA